MPSGHQFYSSLKGNSYLRKLQYLSELNGLIFCLIAKRLTVFVRPEPRRVGRTKVSARPVKWLSAPSQEDLTG
jgi:hypothetical protein